ncbi:MAG: hypothetical protein V4772_03265 [Pseudomonadota bacterium]
MLTERGSMLCITGPETDPTSASDAQRIATLWNAFDGVTTESIFRHII